MRDLDPLCALRTVKRLPISDPAHSLGVAVDSEQRVDIGCDQVPREKAFGFEEHGDHWNERWDQCALTFDLSGVP